MYFSTLLFRPVELQYKARGCERNRERALYPDELAAAVLVP